MAWYVVSYDLRAPHAREDYDRIAEAIRTAVDWCRPLQSFWIIQTDMTPRQIVQGLRDSGTLDDNDALVVLETTMVGDFCRLAENGCIPWLNERLVRV